MRITPIQMISYMKGDDYYGQDMNGEYRKYDGDVDYRESLKEDFAEMLEREKEKLAG